MKAVLYGDGGCGQHIQLHEVVRAEDGCRTGIICARVKDKGVWTETWTWNGELFPSRDSAILNWEINECNRGAVSGTETDPGSGL
jgi:hypothetical protein